MKIICLEEHLFDPSIAKATQKAQATEAPYLGDLSQPVDDDPESFQDDRPHLASQKTIMEGGANTGAERIAEMDRHGIDMQILSYSNEPQLASPEEGIRLAQAANDRLAAVVAAHPNRFQAFATLPWQDPEAASAELKRAVMHLGMVGTLIIGRPGQTFLDDPRYAPVLAELNSLEVPVYVHPGPPLPQVREPYYGGLASEVSARLSLFAWGWHNEAGIHVIRMLLAGVFDRFPKLQVISGHWGEMVPFYLQRLDDSLPQQATGLSRSITETYRQHVFVTPSGMLNLPHFEFVHKVLGADRILHAVDYPYLTLTGARAFLEKLSVSEEDREKIAHRNAELLLRLRP